MSKKLPFIVAFALVFAAGFFWWRSRTVADLQAPAVAAAKEHSTGQPSEARPATAGNQPAAATASAAMSVRLWGPLAQTTGAPLDRGSADFKAAQLKGEIPVGRVALLEEGSVRSFSGLKAGDAIALPLPGGTEVAGVVRLRTTTALGSVQVAGELTGGGSFSLVQGDSGLGGRILLTVENRAVLVHPSAPGRAVLQEVPLSMVLCQALPREPENLRQAAQSAVVTPTAPAGAPPLLSSRPGAANVVYLDFDGATVTDPDWNSGNTIYAAPCALSSSEITAVWNRVKEDYWPFNIDITTDPTRYTSTSPGHRMRVIITPTDTAQPGSGGVAYVGSFLGANSTFVGFQYFQPDVPAWVFNTTVDGIAEAISHEAGHTFGLQHDGENPPYTGNSSSGGEYYYGYGDPNSAVGWAPIMGAGYYEQLVQWSKGEYPQANNQQDDIAILAGSISFPVIPPYQDPNHPNDPNYYYPGLYGSNPTGYYPDDAGDTRAQAASLNLSSGSATVSGFIYHALDNDFYQITLSSARAVTVTANPANAYPKQPNLDIALELQDSAGNVVAASNPVATLDAGVSGILPAGTYYVKLAGTGRPANGSDYGYSSYGSIGQYTLSVVVGPDIPIVTGQTSGRQVVAAGGSTTLSVTATSDNGTISYQWMHDGRPVPGATASSLALSNSAVAASGAYWVVMTNLGGSSRSKPVFVQVTPTRTQMRAWGAGRTDQTTIPAGLNNAIGLSAGQSTVVALKADGTVVQWGDIYGAVPAGLNNVVAVSAGYDHVLALKADGTVVGWGWNSYGQATPPSGLTDVVAIAAGTAFSLALKTDGTMVAWGYNGYGQLAIPAALTGVCAIGAGVDHSVALKADGTALAWGNSSIPGVPAGLNGLVNISAAAQYSLAVKNDGTVTGWGNNTFGFFTPPAGLSGVVAVDGGSSNALALKSDGTVVSWGVNSLNQSENAPALTNVFAVSAGGLYWLALRDASTDTAPVISVQPASQTVTESQGVTLSVTATGVGPFSYQWRKGGTAIAGATSSSLVIASAGPADQGNYDVVVTNHVGSTTSQVAVLTVNALPVVTVTSSSRTIVRPGGSVSFSVSASSSNGALSYQWFRNGLPIAGATSATVDLTNLTMADNGYYLVKVTNDVGTRISLPFWVTVAPAFTQVRAWGANNVNQLSIPAGLTDAYSLAASGDGHILAARGSGTVTIWGDNAPQPPAGLTNVVAVTASSDSGSSAYFALKGDGTVVGWGTNNYALLNIPAGLANVVMISAGGQHAVALKSDGTVVSWGSAAVSTAPVPAGLNNVIAVAAGSTHALALKNDGTVVAWGSVNGYQLDPPAGLSGVTAIAAGGLRSLALKSDGTLAHWGYIVGSDPSASLTGVTHIALSTGSSLVRRNDGTVVAWGFNNSGEAIVPSDLGPVLWVAAGGGQSLAVRDATNDTAPTISVSPVSQTVAEGQPAAFSVTASGVGPFTYRWRKNGVTISGATAATFTIPAVVSSDAGNYDVAVSNDIGTTNSAVAVLTVNPIPVVTVSSPLRQVVTPGASASFSVTATGTGPLSYQWLRNGRPINGATASSYNILSPGYADSGWYVVAVTDNNGTRRSKATFLTVAPTATQLVGWGTNIYDPNIVPAGITDAIAISAGGGHVLVLRRDGSLAASGYGGFISPLPSASTPFVAVTAGYFFCMGLRQDGTVVAWGYANQVPAGLKDVVALAAGSYSAFALKSDGTVVGWDALGGGMTTLNPGLTNVVALTDTYALKADGTVVTLIPSGLAPPAGLSGVTAIASQTQALALKADGTVVAWGDNSYSQATVPSGLANVTAVAAGSIHSLALKSDGTVVAWGGDSSGQTNVPVGLDKVFNLSSKGTFSIALRDATADGAPVITSQPVGLAVVEKQPASFSVSVTGVGPFTYQWRKGTTNINGATSATFTLPSTVLTDAGNYSVVVTNALGSTVSNTVTLTVSPLPVVVTNPAEARRVVSLGQALSFNATATGTGSVSYQWIRNGKAIPGATGSSYAVPSVTAQDAGWYVLLVTDSVGSRRSAPLFVLIGTSRTQVISWGQNNYGQTQVPANLTDAVAISTGNSHTLALKRDGTVVAWGFNDNGQATVPVNLTGVVAVSAGNLQSLALKSDGTVVAWGESSLASVPAGLTDVVAISAGVYRSLALKSDGTVVQWAQSGAVGVGTIPAGLTDAIAISGRGGHALALKSNGTVVAWGVDIYTETVIPAGLNNVVGIESGQYQSFAFKADGTTASWGYMVATGPKIPAPASLTNVVSLSALSNHALALLSDGTVLGWGENFYGESVVPAGYNNLLSVGTGYQWSALLRDASNDPVPVITAQPVAQIVGAGDAATFTVTVTGVGPFTYQWRRNGVALANGGRIAGATTASLSITGVQAGDVGSYDVVITNAAGPVYSAAVGLALPGSAKISAGRYHSLRLDTLAHFSATGINTYGQLGTGNTTPVVSPQLVTIAGQTVADMAAGAQHSLLLTAAGEVWATGLNDLGELGDGSTTNRLAPVKIATGAVGVAASVFHSAFLKADGTLWTMGGSDEGQLGSGLMTGSPNPTPVQIATGVAEFATGNRQTLFVKSDGTLWGAGDLYGNGTLTAVPIQLATGVKTVAAGAYHSLFLKTDGTLWVLGYNPFGQLGTGSTTTLTSPVQIATGVRAIAAGYFHSTFIKTDNTLWAMGRNESGQLGDGTTNNRLTPYQLAANVSSVSASESYTLFAKSDGTIWATGLNGNGQFGNGNNATTSVPVQIGGGALLPPLAPATPAATAGAAADRVHLSWAPTLNASVYEVWRSTTNDFTGATLLAQGGRWSLYEDLTVSPGVTYYYWIVAANPAGRSPQSASVSGSSTGASVAPAITQQPSNQSITAGGNASFTVAASGTPTPTYQWQRMPAGSGTWSDLANGGVYSGATTATLTITGATVGLSGDSFRCRATNPVSSATSNAASLTVTIPSVAPAITQQPSNQSITAGGNASFTVAASGTPTPTYQWQRLPAGSGTWANVSNGGIYSGATTTTLTITGATVGSSGDQFRCVATNTVSAATSNAALLTVNAANVAPSITAQPTNQTITAGNNVTFTVAASGTPAPTFQWQRLPAGSGTWADLASGGAYSGVTTTTLAITGATVGMSGDQFRCVATNVVSSATSNAATLTVNAGGGGPTVAKFAAGRYHSVRLMSDGTVLVSGNNAVGQLGTGGTTSVTTPVTVTIAGQTVTDVSSWSQHTLFLTAAGQVWGTGLNDHGQLGTGGNKLSPVQLTTGASGIASGLMHTAILKSDGTLWTMGGNDEGQLGNGNMTDTSSLVQIASNVVEVAAGTRQTLFRKTDGTLWGTGDLYGTTTLVSTPIQLASGVAAIAAGGYHSAFVKTDGTLWTLGYNPYGQLGNGTTTTATTPVQVATGVASVATGFFHTMFVKTDGTLWAMGYNPNGQLGDGTTTNRTTPVQVATGVTAVKASLDYTLFTKTDGSLWAMGGNASGQFGSGTTAGVLSPVQVVSGGGGGGGNVAPAITQQPANQSITAGGNATFTVAASGTPAPTYQWQRLPSGSGTWANISNGGIYSGATTATLTVTAATTGSSGDQFRAVATNTVSSATSNAATLTVTAANVAPAITQQPANQTITAGGNATFTVAASGTPAPTYQWQRLPAGSGTWSDLANAGIYSGATTTTLTITGAAVGQSGDQFRCVATNSVSSATSNAATLTVNAGGGGGVGIVKFAAGRYHSTWLSAGGVLTATGNNAVGQLGTGNTTSVTTPVTVTIAGQTVTDVSSWSQHTLFLTAAGELWGTGLNDHIQMVAGGGIKTAPVFVSAGAAGMSAGLMHSAILKTDGTLWTLGGNDEGQLGNGNMIDSGTWVQIASNVAEVSAGTRQTLFRKTDGTLWGTGDLYGTTTLVSTPIQLATNVATIAAGGYHSAFVKTDGTLWTLGYNPYGQLGNGNTTTATTPVQVATGVASVATGYFHTLFVKTDGTLWAMGYNPNGQLGDGTTTNRTTPVQVATGVTAVKASLDYTLFTKTDGSLWGMGNNASGQFGNGTTTSSLTPLQLASGGGGGGNVAPAITQQPSNQSITAGSNASFTVAASGTPTPTYQWQRLPSGSGTWANVSNGGIYSGATTVTLTVTGATTGSNGDQFRCVATNTVSSATSNAATLTVNAANVAPAITAQPSNQTITAGNNVTFTVAASGTPAPTFQWQRLPAGSGTWANLANGGAYSGVTTTTLAITGATVGMSGDQFRCVATNTVSSATSNAATLTVNAGGGGGGLTVAKFAAGRYHSVRLMSDGTVSVSGNNAVGQLGTGNTTSVTTPVTVTIAGQTVTGVSSWAQHTLFLTAAGQVWGTGLNDHGQLGTGGNKLSPVQLTTGASGIATGLMHSVVLKTDNTLWTMGGNDEGQLGNGNMTDTSSLMQIATGVVEVSAGTRQTLFRKTDGTLWGTGDLYGTATLVSTPIQLAANVATMSAGGYHSAFIKTDGTLWTLGYNPYGQLGDGTTTTRTTPVQVATGVASVTTGYFHTVFLKTDGTLWAMGYNPNGQLGDGTTTNRTTPVQVASGVTAVHASLDYTLFTKTDGSLWAMGGNASGQFGNGTTAGVLSPVQVVSGGGGGPVAPAITANPQNQSATVGGAVSFSVTASGTAPLSYQWQVSRVGEGIWTSIGDGGQYTGSLTSSLSFLTVSAGESGDQYRCVVTNTAGSATSSAALLTVTAPPPTTYIAAAGGSQHAFFIRSDGAVFGMGLNSTGQLGDGTTVNRLNPVALTVVTSGVTKMAAGVRHSVLVKSDGTAWAMGGNGNGQVGDGTVAMRAAPVQIGTNVFSVAAGSYCGFMVKTGGTLWGFGYGGYGQLGTGTTNNPPAPVQITTGVNIVSAGDQHMLLVKLDGTAWGVGTNNVGQVGDGTTTTRLTLVQIGTGVRTVAAGAYHGFMLKTDNTLWGFGYNGDGELGLGNTTNPAAPTQVAAGVAQVAAGLAHSAFVKTDGTLWTMGDNSYGQLGDGSTTDRLSPVQVATGVASVYAGDDFTIFIKTDGTIWRMGRNNAGQLGDGSTTDRPAPVQLP